MRIKNIIGIIARIIVGVVFVVSAVTKYISLDAVDLFVYEHQIFSWFVTTFATRLLITVECFVGIMLLLGIYPKQIKWTAVIMLVFFTVYILLKPVLFNVESENCHCFGTVLLLNDAQTLIKNIILLVISYFMFWDKGLTTHDYKVVETEGPNGQMQERYKKTFKGMLFANKGYIAVVLFIVLLIAANTIMMPEPIARKVHPKTASVDIEKFERLMQTDSVQNLGVTHGKKILCLYSTGCKYCKRAAIRLDVVRQKYDIADSSFALVFWGSNAKIDSFFVKTQTKVLPHTLVSPYVFLPATKGRQPVIVLMNDGKIEQLLKYPNVNEKDIRTFLSSGDRK